MPKFSQLISDVGFLVPIDNTDATLAAIVARRISAAVKYHTNVSGRWKELDKGRQSLTLASGANTLLLPYDCDDLERLWHEIYNYQVKIPVISRQKFRELSIPTSQSGIPYIATHLENQGVLLQPTSASVLSFASNSALDVTQSIRIYGIVAGYSDSETKALNTTDGTISVSTTKSFTSITRIVKDMSTVGEITITSNSGAVTVAILPALYEAQTLDYRKLEVWNTADQAYTLYADFYIKQRDLVDNNDIPLLDENHAEAMVQLGCFFCSKNQDKQHYKDAYDDILKDLKHKYATDPVLDTRFDMDALRGRGVPDFSLPSPNFGYPIYDS